MPRSFRITRSLSAIALMAALFVLAAVPLCSAPLPQTTTFQGLATDIAGHRLPDGTITLTLRYHDDTAGGLLLYAEQFLNVPVKNGLFNVAMGSGASLGGGTVAAFVDAVRSYNQVFVATSINADPAMTPRVQILSAPYSLRADRADNLGTLGAGQILNTTTTPQSKAGPLTLDGSTAVGYPMLNVHQNGAGYGVTATGDIGLAGFTVSGGGGVFGRVSEVFSTFAYGVRGVNDGPYGVGVEGKTYGNGTSTTSSAIGVHGVVGYPWMDHAFNYAAGVRGQSSVGDGVQGASTNHSGVYGYSNTKGVIGEAVLDAAVFNGTHWGVYGVADHAFGVGVGGDSSAGIGMMGRSGTSYGVIGRSESGIGVRGQSQSGSGPSTGVEGSSGTGIGVNGIATAAGGVALKATAHGADGVALQLVNGPIKVSGAAPTAFVAIAPVYASTTWFAIDNPNCNNDPNAMVFVTANTNPDGRAEIVYDPHPIAVYYDTSRSKWLITNADGVGMPTHAAFNVLVVKH
jgi:hypothetical protein